VSGVGSSVIAARAPSRGEGGGHFDRAGTVDEASAPSTGRRAQNIRRLGAPGNSESENTALEKWRLFSEKRHHC
jgi:hypothetical protein